MSVVWRSVTVLALAALCPAFCGAQPLLARQTDPAPAMGGRLDGAVQPAYRFVEGISDGVYDFVRVHLIRNLLPDGMTRNLIAAPRRDSSLAFAEKLREKEGRFLRRAQEAYPVLAGTADPADPARRQEWRTWAAEEQVSVAVDAMRDTLLQRYGLEFFGRSSETYLKDRRNWDPGLLTMAGLVGGSLLYVSGLHATARLGDWKLGLDLRSGLRLRQALQDQGSARHLAGLELGYKDAPVTLATEWGLSRGRLGSERVGLNYRLKY